MIRWILKWIFKKEYAEALKLLEAAQAIPVRYVKYETYKLDSLQFLEPMQEVIRSTYVKCWLLSRKDEYDRLIKYGTLVNRDQNIGRAMAIDELLLDLAGFGAKYRELIEEQAKDAKVQP